MNKIRVEGLEIAFSVKLVKYLEAGIYEVRIKTSDGISREFFFCKFGNDYVITNAYTKKAQKMDQNKFKKAKQYKKEYEVNNND